MTPIRNLILLGLSALALGALAGCSDDDPAAPTTEARSFTLTIENISADGAFFASGVFNTPVGAGAPAPAFPGEAYEFTFGAPVGSRLSFATMFVQSNDLFYAPSGAGIALYDGMGLPRSGDVTSEVALWDAGTELNEDPGAGANQAPRQGGPDTGPADSDATVRLVSDGFTYPAADAVIQVTLTSLGDGLFRARLENVSDASTLMIPGGGTTAVPLAPGVFVVHTGDDPLFSAGMADMMEGLEAVAEDGDPSMLAAELAARTSIATPLAPGVAVVHSDAAMIFTAGQPDLGLGLEGLAEDGAAAGFATNLAAVAGVRSAAVFSVPVGAAAAGPAFPGQSYTATFSAEPGDRLSFATMFVQSNDLFYGVDDDGLALFDAMGDAVTGDITAMVMLWDAATEANQWPGVGPDQAPRQGGPDTGADDPMTAVRLVNDGFGYPATASVVRVTLSVMP